MASIQNIITERIQRLVHNEILRHFRQQNAESRQMRTDLADCKRRLSKLEKIAEEKDDEIIARWFAQMRANGATLKAFRKKLGISQTDLSILLNSNPATINRWESGKVKLSQKSCERIAKIRSLGKLEVQQLLQDKKMWAALNQKGIKNGTES